MNATHQDGLDVVYGGSLALLTDLYQLTMACGYWKAGTSEREALRSPVDPTAARIAPAGRKKTNAAAARKNHGQRRGARLRPGPSAIDVDDAAMRRT